MRNTVRLQLIPLRKSEINPHLVVKVRNKTSTYLRMHVGVIKIMFYQISFFNYFVLYFFALSLNIYVFHAHLSMSEFC